MVPLGFFYVTDKAYSLSPFSSSFFLFSARIPLPLALLMTPMSIWEIPSPREGFRPPPFSGCDLFHLPHLIPNLQQIPFFSGYSSSRTSSLESWPPRILRLGSFTLTIAEAWNFPFNQSFLPAGSPSLICYDPMRIRAPNWLVR